MHENVIDAGTLGGLLFLEAVIITVVIWLFLHLLFRDPPLFERILYPGRTRSRKVPPNCVLVRRDGSILTENKGYSPFDDDLLLPLDRRMISPYMAPNPSYNLAEPRFFSAFYEPDTQNLHVFVRTLREAGNGEANFQKLDGFLTSKCGSLLLIDPKPDCKEIGEAYGVQFSWFIYPPVLPPEPKDDRDRITRTLQAEFAAMLARMDMTAVGESLKIQLKAGNHPFVQNHPELKTPEGTQMLVDLVQQFIDRAKSAQ